MQCLELKKLTKKSLAPRRGPKEDWSEWLSEGRRSSSLLQGAVDGGAANLERLRDRRRT